MSKIEKGITERKRAFLLGKAGELRVASELLLRGMDVSLSLVDSGVDLILTNGKRLQVKSARMIKRGKKRYRYVFNFRTWKKQVDGDRKKEAHKLENVDFVILWAVDDDLFFIIPVETIRGKTSININARNKDNKFMVFKNNWSVLI